jgi:uncharacterized protein YceH (UPF0502 family)
MYRYNRYLRLFGGEIDVSAKACGTKTKAKAMGRKDAYFMAGPGKALKFQSLDLYLAVLRKTIAVRLSLI